MQEEVFWILRKLKNRTDELRERRWEEKKSIEWFYAKDGELADGQVYHGYPGKIEGERIALGSGFNGRDRYLWLQQKVSVPQAKEDREPVGYFDFGKTGGGTNSGFESLLYVNGHPFQAVDSNHKDVNLAEFAGQEIELTFLLWSGLEGGGVKTTQYHRLSEGWIGYRNKDLEELYYLLVSMVEGIPCLPEESRDRQLLEKLADKTLAFLDWDEDRLAETGKEALAWLNNELDKANEGREEAPCVHAVGHTHIDVSWLWRLKHTREKAQRSFTTVLRLMSEFPEYKFLQSQPQLYEFIKKDAPEIYEGMKRRIAEGRWEADGGMWLEGDCNVTSGESLTRQFLYGIRFIEEEFGRKCKFLWLPDVFGYSWALPQIMKQCGIETFMTTKISWNQYNTIPNDLFWWKGIDGSKILTYFIDVPDPGQDWRGRGSTYNGNITADVVAGTWKKFKNKELSSDVLTSFGFGDGGGGPTREQLQRMKAVDRLPGLPRVKPSTAGEFFDKIHEDVEKAEYVPQWDGELYLEYHRGTYTSQAHNKKNNRKIEYALCETEWLQALAGLHGVGRDEECMLESWRTVLRDQFHDIIPGSSIHEVYEDTAKEYRKLWQDVSRMQKDALNSLGLTGFDRNEDGFCEEEISKEAGNIQEKNGEKAWTLLRFADVKGSELVEIPCMEDGIFLDANGGALPAQKTAEGWVVEAAADPLSGSLAAFVPGAARKQKAEEQDALYVNVEERKLETPFYRIVWEESGAFTSIYDKENDREVLKGKGNILRIFEDKPMNYDAWDIDIYYRNKYEDVPACAVEVKECGALRMKLSFCYVYRKSVIEQEVILYAHDRRIDFKTKVDWHESHRLLKTVFEVDVRATRATYDIQYGYADRPNHWNTSWDWARFEVCGHKWADLSESNYGVSLLNDCKYGYGILDNVMTLSLLKSAKYPDTEADMGIHTFTYALLPHADALGMETIKEGIRLNQPMQLTAGKMDQEALKRILVKDNDAVKIDAVKPAEDGDGVVIRLHECSGGRQKTILSSEFGIKAYAECNLLEEYESKKEGSEIPAAFGPFEIRSYRVWF